LTAPPAARDACLTLPVTSGGSGLALAILAYIQKFIMHYEVLLLIAALPSPAPTTTVTGWAARGAARQVAGQGGGRVRVGEEGSG